ncbi:MAG: hypothetical protein ACHQNA_04960 [Acidimicrobiales bacterium]
MAGDAKVLVVDAHASPGVCLRSLPARDADYEVSCPTGYISGDTARRPSMFG